MIFEEQSTIEHMVFRILTHTQSLIQCQRVQVTGNSVVRRRRAIARAEGEIRFARRNAWLTIIVSPPGAARAQSFEGKFLPSLRLRGERSRR